MQPIPRHQCLVYDGSPASQLRPLAALIAQKLKENNRCVYLNSQPMVVGLGSYLFVAGVDVPKEITKGSLVLSSDQGHLVDGTFDIERMLGILRDAVEQARNDGYQALWVTGDLSWEFGPERNFAKLLEYERRLEELFLRYPTLSGVCQYHTDNLPRETVRQGLETHRALFINETLSRLNPDYNERAV